MVSLGTAVLEGSGFFCVKLPKEEDGLKAMENEKSPVPKEKTPLNEVPWRCIYPSRLRELYST